MKHVILVVLAIFATNRCHSQKGGEPIPGFSQSSLAYSTNYMHRQVDEIMEKYVLPSILNM